MYHRNVTYWTIGRKKPANVLQVYPLRKEGRRGEPEEEHRVFSRLTTSLMILSFSLFSWGFIMHLNVLKNFPLHGCMFNIPCFYVERHISKTFYEITMVLFHSKKQ